MTPPRDPLAAPQPTRPFDPASLAQDWAVIWQSEMAALADDRELREAVLAAAAFTASWPGLRPRPPAPPPSASALRSSAPWNAPQVPAVVASEPPGPMRRRGPRPLGIHLALRPPRPLYPVSGQAAPPPGFPEQDAAPVGWPHACLSDANPLPDAALVAGIAAYRRHPHKRALPDPPCLWQEGDTRLLDYAADLGRCAAAGRPVLFVPSLINRATVLDLLPGRSMLRWLAGHGIRPLLLDWGWPGAVERRFSLTDYIAGRLERAVAATGPVVLAGYCMGGLLCTALAVRRPDLVRGLALLATPWDFHAKSGLQASAASVGRSAMAGTLAAVEPVMAMSGTLPVDALQLMFESLSPGTVDARYCSFGRADRASLRACTFVAVEDWLSDGVPLAAPVARECLQGWYGDNSPAHGKWRVAGLPVDPAGLRQPSLVVVPTRDRVVPAASALALARQLPGSACLRPAAGHVGMIVGSHAEREVWAPLRDWLRSLDV